MTQSLFSTNWYRVAQLKPRLRDAVTVKRQHWRDQLWYLLSDEASGRQHRINATAYQFIGRCDGKLTVQQVWDAILLDKKESAPTQDEVIQLLVQINQSELLQCEETPDTAALFRRRDERAKQKRRMAINPFSLRMPLGDPAPWLNRLDHVAKILFQPATFYIWVAMMLIAVLVAATEWNTIFAHAGLHMLTPRYLTITLICFPIIKALHELSHGLAVRRWGGEVHEFGISLLVFVPAPYVDASAANAFPSARQKAAVSIAGIVVETTLAAIAFLVWMNVQAGLVKDVAFVVMVIGTVSTLLFNGNPLLRFDGYYVLSDLLDIPNLATRSNQYWSKKLHNYIASTKTEMPQLAKGEKKWLLLYAPLSFAYRIFISLIIVLWLGAKWLLVGVIAALYMIFTLLIKPVFRWTSQLLSSEAPGQGLDRVRRHLALLGIAILAFLFMFPMPYSTVAPAVVWLPEQAQIKPLENGFIKRLPVQDGQKVKAGDLLAVLENPDLTNKYRKITSKLNGMRADQFQLILSNPAQAQNINEDIINTEKELTRIRKRIADLRIRAQVDGKLVIPKQADKMGTYVRRGQNIGYVFENTEVSVRAAVAERDNYLVRNDTKDISVWLTESPNVKRSARLSLDVPAATRSLPSPALGDRAGGEYVTDPADSEGKTALEPVFLFDLILNDTEMERVGARALVRFKHSTMPLAMQLYQRATQLFLQTFEPST
ncbi:MAG: efflux RND transporter periplasmic adaptor subunit [Methylophilaceae bacterium]